MKKLYPYPVHDARRLSFTLSLSLSLLLSAATVYAQDYDYDDPALWDVYQPGDLAVTTVADPAAEGDSALQITTLVPRDNWWESIVQTFQDQSLPDQAGAEHTVTFRYRADEARQIRLSILSRPLDTYGTDDTEYYSDFLEATTEYQTFTYTFTSVAEAGVPSIVYVGFLVGGSEVPIYLDAITMESETTTPGGEGGNFDDLTKWNVYPEGGIELVTAEDAQASGGEAIRATVLEVQDNWWEAGVQTLQDASLVDAPNTEHTVTFRYRADEARPIRLSILSRERDTFGSNDTEYYGDFLQATTEYQTFTYTFQSVAEAGVPSIVYVGLLIGDNDTPIYLDDISMTSRSLDPGGEGGNFDDLAKWNFYPEGDIELVTAEDPAASGGEAIRATLLDVKENWYDAGIQTIQDASLPDEAGKRYTVSFRYRADEARQVRLSLRSRLVDTYGTNDQDYYNEFLQATTEYQTFTYTFTSVAEEGVPTIIYFLLMIGDSAVPVYLDDVNIEEAEPLRTNPGVFYVNPAGNDTNSGEANTPEAAWQTMTYALSQIIGGDTLYIADGLYQENNLTVKGVNGSAEAPTVIKSINRWGAKIEGTAQYAVIFEINNSSYVEVDGIEVFNNNNVPFEDWNAGVEIRQGSHHITVRNVYAHDCGCNGISGRESDYMIFERNVLRDNAKTNPYNCSGLSIYQPIAIDDEPGYHIIIRNNVAFENECRLPFTPLGFNVPTDGNGFILDDFNQTQSEGIPPFTAATLVENNVAFNNGGAGIKVYEVTNATIRNNTTWHNNYVLEEFTGGLGDIGLQQVGGSMEVYNNIAVKEFDQRGHGFFLQAEAGTEVTLANNLIVGSTSYEGVTPTLRNNQIVTADRQSFPAFANATEEVAFTSVDDFKAYFGLREGSPAIDAADAALAPDTDLNRVDRPVGEGVDIGAYEGTVEGVGPLPQDETLVAQVKSTTLDIAIDGIRDGAYISETYSLGKTVVAPDGDLSVAAEWTSLWDEENLYLYVAVTDDDLSNDSETWYDDDAVEILIDADNSRDSTYGDNDFRYVIGWNDELTEVSQGATDGVEASIVEADGGYQVEVAIPWATLKTDPADSTRLGLDVQVNDDDAGGTRDSKIAWQALQDSSTPAQFGEALLLSVAPPPAIASTDTPITVDGTAEASWTEADTYALTNQIQPTVDDSTDLSARWRALWDEENIYFFVAVNDDSLRNDSPNWYNDDGVEIYIDANNSKLESYDDNDYQLTVGWNDGDSIFDTKGNIGPGAVAVVVDTETGYNVEVAIPWSALGATPAEGLFFGLDVHAIDDDNGEGVDGKLAWFTTIDESFRNPSLFGTAYLAGSTDAGQNIPGKIEGENYKEQTGVTTAPSGDDDTEAVVGIQPGDYLDYEVTVEETGMYKFTYRVARERGGVVAFSLKQNDEVLHYGKLLKRTKVDEWANVEAYAYLEEGDQTLRLQSIGRNWKFNWLAAEAVDMSVPGQIEAEAFAESAGYVPVLPSGDTDETDAISFLRKGASVAYPVTVAQAGTYSFTYRVRTVRNKASFRLQLKDKTLHTVKVKRVKKDPFGWQEVSATAELPAGSHTLRLVGQQTGGSINWWRAERNGNENTRLANDPSMSNAVLGLDAEFSVYPNPTQGTVHLSLPGIDQASIDIYDFQGRMVQSFKYSRANNDVVDLQGLPEGLYMIRAKSEGQEYQRRILLQE